MKTRSSFAKMAEHASSRLILSLVLGALSPVAFAFSVGKINISGLSAVGDPNHEAITLAALASVSVTLSGSQVKFSDKASNSIRDWNVDTDSKYWDLTEVHFDDEDFNEGNLLLFGLRASIKKRAIDGKYTQAQELLGRALHTVQDFYAHSTWVEKGFSGLAPLALQSSSLFVKSSGATCTDSPTQLVGSINTGIILDSQLTGEYFALEQLTGNVLWSNSSSKCIHGSSKYSNSQALGAGINKDTVKRDFFSDAKTKAVAASKQFVEVIIGDLAGNESAIRGLLDQPATKVTFTARGKVIYIYTSNVNGSSKSVLSHPVAYGDDLTFTVTLFQNVPDRNSSPDFGSYEAKSVAIKIGSNPTITVPGGSVNVSTQYSGGMQQVFTSALSVPISYQYPHEFYSLVQLQAAPGVRYFLTDALPSAAPDPGAFGTNFSDRILLVNIQRPDASGVYDVYQVGATITSMTRK